MPGKGRALIPVDLRGMRKPAERLLLMLDETEEQPCLQLDIMTDAVNVTVKLDEQLSDFLLSQLSEKHLHLVKKIAFQKGALNAVRRKKSQ